MKKLVIYYSYTGNTRKIAKEMAQEKNADLVEVRETKTRSKLQVYVLGSFAAMRQKPAEVIPVKCDFTQYDEITIAMPIWAGYPAPVFNNIVRKLPAGRKVELVMVSGSGHSDGSAEKTKKLIAARDCVVISYQDKKA